MKSRHCLCLGWARSYPSGLGAGPQGLLDACIAVTAQSEEVLLLGQRPHGVLPVVCGFVTLLIGSKVGCLEFVFRAAMCVGSVDAWYTTSLDIEETLTCRRRAADGSRC